MRALAALWRRLVPGSGQPARCGTCRYYRADAVAEQPGAGTCRAELPRVLTYSAPSAVVRGVQQQAAVNVQTYWPPVAAAEWCARYRRS